MIDRKTKVLVVDDSAIVRKMLTDALAGEPDIEVVGSAPDPFIARDKILALQPDILTLDIEMPRMDGLSFLRRLMAHRPMPVIIVSSLAQSGSTASLEALQAGAIDVIPKPGGPYSVGQVVDKLKERIRALRTGPAIRYQKPATVTEPLPPSPSQRSYRGNALVVIGASTGGTQAIEGLLTRMPADVPPIVIVQHMPASFTRLFAERLDSICPMHVLESQGSEVLQRGTVYIAPGDYHLLLERQGLQLKTLLRQGPMVCHQRPAVDVLFSSVARLQGIPVVAVLLTGMGSDGADGMVALRKVGAETIAEAEDSCVVFGMPKEAIARGGAIHVASLLKIPNLIFQCLEKMASQRKSPADADTRVTA
jgi:two-component system, chemotaxis family, protein-glutamate methylesterase/glutaminase